MEQKSLGKLCQWHNLGLPDATGPARCRISVHLRASACICGHFRTSACICVHLEVLYRQTSGDQSFYFVSFRFNFFFLPHLKQFDSAIAASYHAVFVTFQLHT